MGCEKKIGWANTLELVWPEVGAYTEAIERLRQGELHAITVRGVYSPNQMRELVGQLEAANEHVLKTYFPEDFKGWFFGQNLNLLTKSMGHYFEQAEVFSKQLNGFFEEGRGPTSHLADVLEALDVQNEYSAAPGPDLDQAYMFGTIRGHGEGGYIPPHFDNEVQMRPSYEHLSTLVEAKIYSAVLLIGEPEAGGALELFNCEMSEYMNDFRNVDTIEREPDTGQFESIELPTNAGDLLIVDSGRYLHRVVPVRGTTIRWSLCSFMAKSVDRASVYCWG